MQLSTTTTPGRQQALHRWVAHPRRERLPVEQRASQEVAQSQRSEHAQLAKIEEANLKQKMFSEVHKRLDHQYARLATSKEVITKHLSLMQEQHRSRN